MQIQRIGGPDPPGKSQVKWVSIEISIWTPPHVFPIYVRLCKTFDPRGGPISGPRGII